MSIAFQNLIIYLHYKIRGKKKEQRLLFPTAAQAAVHKSFEKGFGGKLFQKFSPKKFAKNFCFAACAAVGKRKRISFTARYIKILKRGLGKNFFKSFSPKKFAKNFCSAACAAVGKRKRISFTARYIKILKRGLGKNFFKSFSPKKFAKNFCSAACAAVGNRKRFPLLQVT